MLMKEKSSDELIRITEMEDLISPYCATVTGCKQAGEEEQEPADYHKHDLVFPSGELLPRCWQEPN
jgi:hypothetical protein